MTLSDLEIVNRYLAGEFQNSIARLDGRSCGAIHRVLLNRGIVLRDATAERRRFQAAMSKDDMARGGRKTGRQNVESGFLERLRLEKLGPWYGSPEHLDNMERARRKALETYIGSPEHLAQLAEARTGRSPSKEEQRIATALRNLSDCPRFVNNVRIVGVQADFWFPDMGVVVQWDGLAGHGWIDKATGDFKWLGMNEGTEDPRQSDSRQTANLLKSLQVRKVIRLRHDEFQSFNSKTVAETVLRKMAVVRGG